MENFSLSRNELFDSTQNWKDNSEKNYSECIQNLIMSAPFGAHKFYIFSFIKRVDDASGIKKMIHQPRLTKPEPIPGGTLMRVDPRDPYTATLLWTLPNDQNFNLYKKGKMYADPFVHECIERFKKNPKEMMRPEVDDLTDEQIREIYKDMSMKQKAKKATAAALKILRG
jgi:hypothetical protein